MSDALNAVLAVATAYQRAALRRRHRDALGDDLILAADPDDAVSDEDAAMLEPPGERESWRIEARARLAELAREIAAPDGPGPAGIYVRARIYQRVARLFDLVAPRAVAPGDEDAVGRGWHAAERSAGRAATELDAEEKAWLDRLPGAVSRVTPLTGLAAWLEIRAAIERHGRAFRCARALALAAAVLGVTLSGAVIAESGSFGRIHMLAYGLGAAVLTLGYGLIRSAHGIMRARIAGVVRRRLGLRVRGAERAQADRMIRELSFELAKLGENPLGKVAEDLRAEARDARDFVRQHGPRAGLDPDGLDWLEPGD